MMEPSHENLSLRRQCELLSLNRSTVYYKPRALFDDTTLANEIYQLWHEMPFYGYRRMTAELRRRGHQVNGKRVLRLMKEMHLEALYPKPQTSLKGKKHKIYPYLLKDVEVAAPNEAWCTDITYLKLPSGFIYLVALIDIYSRYVLAWRLSNTMDTHFCVEMLEEALTISTPCILNTDQGSQFTSEAWVSCVEGNGIKVSMDGKGRWADNITIERFWRSLKYEHFLLHSFDSIKEVRQSIAGYITLYNQRRLHQSLGYRTPAEVYGARHQDC
jgi:putative transposase